MTAKENGPSSGWQAVGSVEQLMEWNMPQQAMESNQFSLKVDAGYLIISTPHTWGYDIPLHELKTKQGMDRWMDHLSEKTWVTPSIIYAVRRLVAGL